jgi:DNA-binding transcriptional LysR family regulator
MAQPARTLDIAELRAFCIAADLGSLGRAAVALRTSQPAVSKRLKGLEALAGTELLERSRHGVTLTAAGRSLYPEARRLLEQAQVVERLLGGLERGPEPLRLAVSHTIAESYLAPELVLYETKGAHPPIELIVANSVSVRSMVSDGHADLGIAAAALHGHSGDGLEELSLVGDRVILAVPQAHRWFQRDEVPLVDFLREPLIVRDPRAQSRQLVETLLAERGLSLADPRNEVGSTIAAKREAIEGTAPVLLSALSLNEKRDRLYARPVEGVEFERRFVIVCRSLQALAPAARELADFLRRAAETGAEAS